MDTSALFNRHLASVRELAQRHQADHGNFVIVGATAVLLHWYSVGRERWPLEHALRMTTDIDIAVTDQALGEAIVAANREIPVEVLHMRTPEGRSRVEFAFEDKLTVELEGGVKALAAGTVALFVMKSASAAADGRWVKRGSDLRDLYSLLRLYGAAQIADRFSAYATRDLVTACAEDLQRLLAHEGARGYSWLFEEMNLADAEGVWVRQAFDLLFYELKQRGFSL